MDQQPFSHPWTDEAGSEDWNDDRSDDEEVQNAMGKMEIRATSAFAPMEHPSHGFTAHRTQSQGAFGEERKQKKPSRLPSTDMPLAGHGFDIPKQTIQPTIEQGMLVFYSITSSIFYTKSHKQIAFEEDASLYDLQVGDSAQFQTEPSTMFLTERVDPLTLRKIPNIFPYEKRVYNDEIYMKVVGCLTPQREIFECVDFCNLKLGSDQTTLKLYNRSYIDKARIVVGHNYDIYVRFCSDDLMWKFECIDQKAHSYILEEEDEIDRYKRLNKEKEESHSRKASSGLDDFERVDSESLVSASTKEYDAYGRRASGHVNPTRPREERSAFPVSAFSARPSTYAPSVATVTTQHTSATLTSEKEQKALRKELEKVKRMLKNVWSYRDVQTTVKVDNFYLYETVDDWMKDEAEDESER